MRNTRETSRKYTMPLSHQVAAGLLGVSSLIGMMGGCDEVAGGTAALAEGVGSMASYNMDGTNQPPTEEQVIAAPSTTIAPVEEALAITPEVVATPTTLATTPVLPVGECIGGTYDGWYFDPIAYSVIDTIEDYSVPQKDFLKFALNSVCLTKQAGALTNPAAELAKASLESNSGQDTLAPYYNFNGHKAGKNDPYVEVWTKEDYGNGPVRVMQKFKVYEDPMGSFWDTAEMFGRLDHFSDTAPCRFDMYRYMQALQHQLNESTCEIEKYQGEEGVLSYATQGMDEENDEPEYENILMNRAEHIKVEQYIYRP